MWLNFFFFATSIADLAEFFSPHVFLQHKEPREVHMFVDLLLQEVIRPTIILLLTFIVTRNTKLSHTIAMRVRDIY